MSGYFSPKDVAAALGVSESSLKRWVDKGLIRAEKTAGGHRRLGLDAVLEYVRSKRRGLIQPEVLGLPAGAGISVPEAGAVNRSFLQALISGDELTASQVILDAFIGGFSVAGIFDEIVAPGFETLGSLWKCGSLAVYQERRACEVCTRVLHELRRAVGPGPAGGPKAVGGTLDGDPYTIATAMAELVLRDAGCRATSLGNMLPFDTLSHALENERPQLMWISVTVIRDQDRFTANLNALFEKAQSVGAALVVGGQALTSELRRLLRYTAYCDNFRHMESLAQMMLSRPSNSRMPHDS